MLRYDLVRFAARFDTRNTQKLMEDMSLEEMRNFEFNVRSVNWEHYIVDIHIPGEKRHVMKERLVINE